MVIWLLAAALFPLSAVPLRRAVGEAVEAAARVSRASLDDAMRKSLHKSLNELCRRYGDEALQVVSHGGLEVVKVSAKYGDDFWRAAKNAPPAALRSLVLHPAEMLPAAGAVGREFLLLEGKLPGLALEAFRIYGDEGVRYLSLLPTGDAAKLIAYGARRNSPEVSAALLKGYRRTSGRILNSLDGKKIMAAGLSAAMVAAAWQVSDGAGDGLRELALRDPESFGKVISNLTLPFWLLLSGCVVILLLPWFVSSFRRAVRELCRKSPSGEK